MTKNEEDRLATLMAQEMRDEIDAVVFFQTLCHEIIADYCRHGIAAGQNLVEVKFNDKCCWLPIYHLAVPPYHPKGKPDDPLILDTICINAVFPEVEILAGSSHILFLGDPQFIENAERIVREAIQSISERAIVYHYTYQHGTYYLLRDSNKPPTAKNGLLNPVVNNIILASDEIAICFAHDQKDDTYILHKHGNPTNVHKWAKKTREAYRCAGMEELAKSIAVIEGKFPVDEINKVLDNTGYIKAFLRKYNLI